MQILLQAALTSAKQKKIGNFRIRGWAVIPAKGQHAACKPGPVMTSQTKLGQQSSYRGGRDLCYANTSQIFGGVVQDEVVANIRKHHPLLQQRMAQRRPKVWHENTASCRKSNHREDEPRRSRAPLKPGCRTPPLPTSNNSSKPCLAFVKS